MTTPATSYSPRSLHTQTTLTVFLSKFAEWPAFKPSLYLFYVFHGKREKTPDRRLFAEGKKVCSNFLCGFAKLERTFIKTKSYSAFWEGFRAVGHSKRHRFSQTEPSFSPPVLCMWYRPDNNNVGSLFKQKGCNWDKALACVADTLHCRHGPMV